MNERDLAKIDWLYKLRRCTNIITLEKVIEHCRYTLTDEQIEAFNSAADHRLAELTMGQNYEIIPKNVWHYVK